MHEGTSICIPCRHATACGSSKAWYQRASTEVTRDYAITSTAAIPVTLAAAALASANYFTTEATAKAGTADAKANTADASTDFDRCNNRLNKLATL